MNMSAEQKDLGDIDLDAPLDQASAEVIDEAS